MIPFSTMAIIEGFISNNVQLKKTRLDGWEQTLKLVQNLNMKNLISPVLVLMSFCRLGRQISYEKGTSSTSTSPS